MEFEGKRSFGGKKQPPVLTPEQIAENNAKVLEKRPNLRRPDKALPFDMTPGELDSVDRGRATGKGTVVENKKKSSWWR